MSEYSDQRNRIVSLIEAIPDIGLVHGRPRYGRAQQHWVTTIDGKPQIRAWEVGLGEDPDVQGLQQSWRHRYRAWKVTGYVGLEDEAATYDTLVELAYAVADAIDADPTLAGTALEQTEACVVSDPDPIFLATADGQALCWGAEIRFTVLTVVTP